MQIGYIVPKKEKRDREEKVTKKEREELRGCWCLLH